MQTWINRIYRMIVWLARKIFPSRYNILYILPIHVS